MNNRLVKQEPKLVAALTTVCDTAQSLKPPVVTAVVVVLTTVYGMAQSLKPTVATVVPCTFM